MPKKPKPDPRALNAFPWLAIPLSERLRLSGNVSGPRRFVDRGDGYGFTVLIEPVTPA